jgi:hypothetical protein
MTDQQIEQLAATNDVLAALTDDPWISEAWSQIAPKQREHLMSEVRRIIAAAVAKVCGQARYHCDQGIGRADNFLAGLAAANNRGHVFVMIDAIRTDIVEARAALPQPSEVK